MIEYKWGVFGLTSFCSLCFSSSTVSMSSSAMSLELRTDSNWGNVGLQCYLNNIGSEIYYLI